MKAFLILFLGLAAGLRAEDAKGGFETMIIDRPRLSWEALRGYRLFFHPEDKEPLRRSLILAIPTDRKVRTAWSLVRPLALEKDKTQQAAWLRVEGKTEGNHIAFEWDGKYRDAEFPDQTYRYEIHVRWMDGDSLDQQVLAIKSKDHPKLVKAADQVLEEHPMSLIEGRYEADKVVASVSLSETDTMPLEARVYAPSLEDLYLPEGIQVSYLWVEDEKGGIPIGRPVWTCACQAALPADSPARKKAKKVRCDWDLNYMEYGTYELRLSLYHHMKHPAQFDACDVPVLDEDRIRVQLRP